MKKKQQLVLVEGDPSDDKIFNSLLQIGWKIVQIMACATGAGGGGSYKHEGHPYCYVLLEWEE